MSFAVFIQAPYASDASIRSTGAVSLSGMARVPEHSRKKG